MTIDADQLLHDYEEMFMTKGWKHFVENIFENHKAIFPMLMVSNSTERDLQFCKGKKEVYEYIMGFESQIKLIKEHIELGKSIEQTDIV